MHGMAHICILFSVFLVFTAPVVHGDDLDLTSENVRSVMRDFAHELSNVQAESIDKGGRRRSLLSIPDVIPEIPDVGDFGLDIDLSDFISGLLNTQIFDFVKDIPTTNAGWEKTIKTKYKEFCTDPEKESGEELLEKCEGPEITFELVPGVCKVVDREHSEFECEPPRLEYYRTGPRCTSSYREAAKFIDKECKFVHQLGVEKELILGGGTKDTELEFGKKKVGAKPDFDVSDILDVVSGLFSDLLDFPDVSQLTSILS